ncbi:MAG: succinate dehydrogenase/fumarate reductase iron-sulfur subunit [Bdellovibrionales bacterium]|nr:succinate dehydrogenase/fumarate reductase iron-sulfur subunit [Bdellovibrionales bacterium]
MGSHGSTGSHEKAMRVTLFVWRQSAPSTQGEFKRYEMNDVSPDMSFLEMIDVLNGRLEERGEEPIVFESDCREGICGACSMVINGRPHGPQHRTTTCQLHMRSFHDGDTIYIEPWRAHAFPVIKDLMVDRGAFDRIIQAGGFVTVRTGSAPDANDIPVPRDQAEDAMDAAACIGCGACVAACPNGAAMLFTAAKIGHLASLPQGQPERFQRVKRMVEQMDSEIFGSCTNYGECQDSCPKGISIKYIGQMNRDYAKALLCRVNKPQNEVRAQ